MLYNPEQTAASDAFAKAMASNVSSNLPRQTTSFVGRERQVEELRARLQKPDCRLLTLVGPGGIGKTRLAVAVAVAESSDERPVVYAPLQAVASADLIPSAIADAAGYTLAGHEPLPVQLLHHLRDKKMLLVLDNVEHLLDATDLLLDIVHEAPDVQLLLTSREALNLREEWLYPVPGLPVPPAGASSDEASSFGAVQLFVDRAQQARHGFRLEDDAKSVVAICRAVDGMPLAIELAASWLRVLDRAAIADRLASSLDLLTTQLRNVPERHQSIRAVFDGSWEMLDEQEREVFAKLSVFRGGFTYEAAEHVAGANAVVLASLISKSLIYLEDGGRYEIHELLRQYAAEKLAESPEGEVAQRAHGEHYLKLVSGQRTLASSLMLASAAKKESDNVRLAWKWALDQHEYALIHDVADPVMMVFQLLSRYLEGASLFLDSLRRLQHGHMTAERAAVLTELATHYGWFCLRLGQLDDAETALAPARDLYDRFNLPPRPIGCEPFGVSMHVALARGDYVQATEFGQRILALADERGGLTYDFNLYFPQASAALAHGEYERARQLAEEGLARARDAELTRDSAFFRDMLGQIARIEGDLDTATQYFETAYLIFEELEESGGKAGHLAHLADVAAARGDWTEARRLYARSFALYDQTGDRGGAARARLGLGVVARETGEPAAARSHFGKALSIVVEAQLPPALLRIAAAAGDLLLREDATRMFGLRTLSFVQLHPACDAETRVRVAESFSRNGPCLDSELHAVGDNFESLNALVDALQAELAAPHPSPKTLHPVVESLTAREEEVLHLLSQGRSNAQIAAEMIVAEGTVKAHASNIYRKLGVANRTEAVARARELGLLA